MQVPRGNLRAQGVGQLRRGEGRDDPVGQHSGCVQHAGHRVLRRHCRHRLGQCRPVCDVAGDNDCLGTEPGQLRDQLRGARRGGAAAAEQQQVPYTVLGD